MQKLVINVEDPADLLTGYGAGALIRVERDTSSAFTGATEITTIAIVTGTARYEYWDATGTSSHYYRVRYSKASPAVATDYSSYSDTFQVTTSDVQEWATAARMKLRMGITNSTDDDLLTQYAMEANTWLQGRIGRPVGPVASTTYFFDGADVIADGRCLPVPFGVRSVSALAVRSATNDAYTSIPSSDYYLRPRQQHRDVGWPATQIWLTDVASSANTWGTRFPTTGFDSIQMTATGGWEEQPADLVELANRLAVSAFRARAYGTGSEYVVGEDGERVFEREMSARDWGTIKFYRELRV